MVDGSHSWLLADPDRFSEVITNDVEVARLARSLGGADDASSRPSSRRSDGPVTRPEPRSLSADAARRDERAGCALVAAASPQPGGQAVRQARAGDAEVAPAPGDAPRRSSSASSGTACLRVVPTASRNSPTVKPVAGRRPAARPPRGRPRRRPTARSRSRRARPPGPAAPAPAARPGRRRRAPAGVNGARLEGGEERVVGQGVAAPARPGPAAVDHDRPATSARASRARSSSAATSRPSGAGRRHLRRRPPSTSAPTAPGRRHPAPERRAAAARR